MYIFPVSSFLKVTSNLCGGNTQARLMTSLYSLLHKNPLVSIIFHLKAISTHRQDEKKVTDEGTSGKQEVWKDLKKRHNMHF